jgi:hypothetical protein
MLGKSAGEEAPAMSSSGNQPAAEAAPTLPLEAALPTPTALRTELEDLVVKELLGPAGGPLEEVDESRVSDRYLVGILAPRRTVVRAAESDSLASDGAGTVEDGNNDDLALPMDSLAPAAIGLTCTVKGGCTALSVTPSWGRYARERSDTLTTPTGNPKMVWKRYPMGGKSLAVPLVAGDIAAMPADTEQPDVVLRGRVRKLDGDWLVSLFLVNAQLTATRRPKDDELVFQPELQVSAADGSAVFHKRTRRSAAPDDEQLRLEMLYRRHAEFAVGHGVAVDAQTADGDPKAAVSLLTRVTPTYEVPVTTPPTAEDNSALASVVLDMQHLAEMPDGELVASLRALTQAYSGWIASNQARVEAGADGLDDYEGTAREAMEACSQAQERIEAGIALLETNPNAMRAFRFANQAMWQQRVHALLSERKRAGIASTLEELDQPANRSWRPFQLAFVLLNLPGVTQLDHPDRGESAAAVADLLWFPTGGGKTEAYLGLTAYTMAMRRLRGVVGGRLGHAGVAVIMRYTLRLLTLQQFQRAAALICACEVIRRADAGIWGAEPFRIGLWVGMRTTPNTIDDAHESILRAHGSGGGRGTGSPLQLTNCPWCGSEIKSGQDVTVETYSRGRARVFTFCGDQLGRCDFSRSKSPDEGIPVLTVDEEIYRRLPALLIATVDKFAQMPWNGRTQMLFGQVDGYCPRHGFTSPCMDDAGHHPARNGMSAVRRVDHGPLRPPDLIIQDELHLISGPLGSLVGLYESAVDQLCTWTVDGRAVRPKLIASTATIKQAREQLRSLFLRDVRVFPPQGLDVEDNFFSVQRAPGDRYPGRRYIGVAAFGRRLKLALIRVYVAYLSAGQTLFAKYGRAIDPWMTLLGYFNSMRELGGMRRLVDDDVRSRLRDMDRRGMARRHSPALEELTSRKNSRDIPALLDRLEVQHDPAMPPHAKRIPGQTSPYPLDVVLATNMVSVGVDIKRLGLMVVAGQPKGTSEYIQATSRVGRNATAPGLVCTVYNWARPRDLSHYERFAHYHSTFYQHVEALSVTPFAARAVDRGLSAILTALVRLPGGTYNANQAAGQLDRTAALVQSAVAAIARRAAEVTQSAAEGQKVQSQLQSRLDHWLREAAPKPGGARLGYQTERDGLTRPLLQKAGIGDWDIFTCLGSLRDVEPSVNLLLDDRPLDDGYGQGYTQPAAGAADGTLAIQAAATGTAGGQA